jgi:hypothetical protein
VALGIPLVALDALTVDDSVHHRRRLHRLARAACARQRFRRRDQPVGGRHDVHLRFLSFLERVPVTVFRAKEVLWLDRDERWISHLVGTRFTLDETR